MAEFKNNRTRQLREKYKNSTSSSYVRDDGKLRKSTKDIYLQYNSAKASENITNKIKTLLTERDNLYSDYTSRFFDEDGNFKNQYRNDTKDALYSYSSKKTRFDTETENILKEISLYEDYLNPEFVSSIKSSLQDTKNGFSDILTSYKSDHDYFSKYKNEDDYNQKVVIPQKQNEAWASADTKVLKTELNTLKKDLEEAKSKQSALDTYKRSGVSGSGTPEEAKFKNELAAILKKYGYSSVDEFESAYSEKNAFYNNATRVQEGIALGGINDPNSKMFDPDFEIHAIKGEAMGDEKKDGWLTPDTQRKNQVAYLRNNPEALEMYENSAKSANGGSWGTSERILKSQLIYIAAKYMKEEEFQKYNAYMGKGDEESAYKYLESIEDVLNERQGEEIAGERDNLFKKMVFTASAGLDQWEQGIISLGNTEGEYRSPTATQYASSKIKSDIEENNGAFWSGAYDLGVTTANMMPSILVSAMTGNLLAGAGFVNAAGQLTKGAASVAKLAGVGVLGSSAAGNGYQEMLNLGYDKNQAQAYGTLVGISEAGLEYVLGGISSLGGTVSGGITDKVVTKLISNVDKAIAKVAIGAGGKLVGSMVSEFGEEYLQEVLDPVFKNMTLKTNEDIKLFSTEALYSGILGALSAGLLEGGSTISGEVATYKAGKDVKNSGQLSNLKKFGTSFSADTVAYQIASQVNENTDAYTIGQLLHEVGADSLSETNIADIVKSLERKGIDSAQAYTIAKWLNSAVMGENFSPLQRLALTNPDISQTFKDVIINQNSTVNQRMQGYRDILQSIANEKASQKANKAKAKAEKKANKKSKTTEETKNTPFIPYSSEEIARRQASGEAVFDSEGKSIPKSEKALESKYGVNIEGKTVNTKTGDEVNIAEISSIDKGKMTLKLENGETVDASDISFGTKDEALIYSTVLDMGVNVAVANSLVKNYNPSDKLSGEKYALGVKEAYKYGSYGMPISEISKNGFAADLSEAQRTHAYNLGKADTASKIEKAQAEVKKATSNNGGFDGKVHFNGDVLALKEVQRESLKRMGLLSEVLGVDFHVFESYMQGNSRVFKDTDGTIKKAPNGYYKDGKIYIDLNAGLKGQGIMIYTVAHELTHWIREWSPAKFKVLADFLMEQYGEKGQNVNDLVQAQIDKAKKNNRDIDFDTAYEEVIADSMETMLSDDAVYEKILELKSKDASIVKKIGEFFAKIIDSFKKLMKQYSPETPEGKLVSQMYDSFTKLQELFAEALVDASDNYQANKGQKNTTSEGDVKFMARNDVLSWDINWDSDNFSDIKSQLIKHQDEVNKMNVVTKVNYTLSNKKALSEQVNEILKNNFGYKIETQNYGTILFDPKAIDKTMDYINNPAEAAALLAAPYVLKRGKAISGHKNHKNKGNPSVTFAAPAELNGEVGNVAVAVLYGTKHRIHALRVLTPSGKVFELSKTKDTESTSAGSTTKGSVRSAIDSVSKDSISQTSKKSQEKQSGRDNTIGERNLEDFAEVKDTEGKTLFQYRAMESDEDVYREMLKTTKVMNDLEIDNLFNTIDKAMDIIKDNLEVLDYAWDTDIDDRAFNPVKPNSDSLYQVSVDFSTLCRKRLLQQAIQVQLQEALNKPLTREEGIAIRDALITIQEEGRQIEVACALCYVESARMKSPTQIKKFLETREKVLKEFFATKSGGDIKGKIKQSEIDVREKFHKENPNGIKGKDGTMLDPRTAPLKAMPKKYADQIRDAKRTAKESYIPTTKEQKLIDVAKGMTISDFTSPEGLENLAKKYPELFDAYTSYIRNATKSKGIEGDTWWRAGDSQSIGDTLIANMNAENGLRSQSWSDFQVIHLLDYMAATIELSTRKAKMQAYTKVPDFVELMGNTGEMINLSLIPTRHFNGVLEFDSVEGMAFEESLRLRDKYHATAGTIAIGIDNKQIQMLLADSNIDYVIPYHKSGMAASIRKLMHIPTWSQYEDYQSEKNLSRDDAKRQAKKYGVKLLAESDANYQKHPNFSDWFDIKEARQIAKMENSNPTDKAMKKKYGVMYGGYMAMQNAANNYLKLCAERGISPKFSHEKADFTVEDNYWKLLIDRKMIDNVTGEVIEQQSVKPIFDQGEVLRILNDELERYPKVKADQDYATRKVTENFLSGNIKGGMSAEAIAKAMKKPVDNIAKVNILASVEDSKLSDRDSATFEGKPFWSGSVSLIDGVIEEVHSYGEAEFVGFHHSLYFSQAQVEKMERGENAFFWVDDGIVYGEWRESVSESIIKKIEKQINIMSSKNEDIRYSERVTDEETLDYLNEQIEKGEYIKVYRSFQVIDGGLYAPMNAVDRDENGKNKRLGYRSEYGVWEKSTESPEIAQRYMDSHPEAPYAKFDLDGVDNKTNAVAYNPYLHASNLVLNDQFAAAYRRNLITVECYVPLSEANGIYKAQYAKDATGWVDWKAGGVAGKLLKVKPEYTRKLFVSRYMLPVRQVPDSEVAAMYKEYLDGTDIAVPWNVVTPSLRNELEKAGVNISYEDVKAGSKTISFNNVFSNDVKLSDRDPDAAENIEKINKQLAKENVKLIEDVKYLKELVKLQGKETHGKILKKSSVELVAKRLMTDSSSKGEVPELANLLTDVYGYIAQGEDVSWDGIKEKSQAVVDWLMQHEYHKEVRTELANEILNHLRTTRISLDPLQKKEASYHYGSYGEFHKRTFGRLKITNDGVPLDSIWQELAGQYPGVFDENTNSNDQPIELMNIVSDLLTTYEYDELDYTKDPLYNQWLIEKVYEGYWDVSALHTVADVKQKEINLLKSKHKEKMDEVKQNHSETISKIKQEHRNRVSELRTQYREREESKIKKVAEYYQKSRKEAVDRVKEAREKKDAVTKLQRLVLDTAKWVSYPAKDDVKCPDIIRFPYAEFLNSIDLSSKRLLSGGEPTQNDLRVASAMDSLAKAIEKKLGTQSPDTATDVVLDTGYLDLPVDFVENIKEMAETLKNRMITDGHVVNSMTSEEVKSLIKFIKTLNHSIKEMSTLYSNMRFAKVEQLGNDTMLFLKGLGEHKDSNSIVNFVTWDNALPYYTFKRFGVAGESVFEELMDAQDKLANLANVIFKFKEKTWTDKEASEWSKDTHTIKLPSGRELTLTSADAMSIYCLSRREQGRQHLLGGGVRVLGIEKNGKKANDSRSLLNVKDIEAIRSSLSKRQIEVAEAIQEYMSTVCAEWGNEISMKRFLTKEFTERFYFPIESNDENLDTKDPKAQQSDLYRLLNISATKPLVRGANNEVILRNVFDVFTNHSSDMAKLNAYGMALLDYMKWINYREKTINDDGQVSVNGVRKSMEKAYGKEAKKYIIGLIKDINGRSNDGGDHPFLMKMTRAAKTAMVGANLRVSLLQFTAYPRAAMVLSNKSLALGLTKVPQIEKAKKYCGIALWKSFGFYDTNISRSIEDQIKGTTNIRQKLIELSLKGAEWGDAITWGCLWNACEYEVAKTKQYKVGSEEFNQAVGKKLRDVVYATQVVDSTLTRSQMMRNKSGLTQSASAFMSEPTVSANILMDAAFQFNLEKRRTGSSKLAWQKSSKYIGKAIAVYSIGQIIAALAEGIMDAYRDDDEEFATKFGEAFVENAISDLNPFNKIPIIADFSDLILSWFGIGFSSSNSLYLQAVSEANNAFDTWAKVINGEGGKTVYSGIYSTTKLLSYITGISASGAMREVVTLWNNTAGSIDPYLKIRTYESSATDKGIAEYKFDKGDTSSVKTTVSKMIEDKVKSGKTEKESKSAVRASFTSTYKTEYIDAVKAMDYEEMNRIRKFLYATGLYGTLSELDETLKKWRTAE